MHILHAVLRFTSQGYRSLQRTLCGQPRQQQRTDTTTNDPESAPLLRNEDPSLTSEFQGFEQSTSAFWICFFHAALYYSLAVLGFSYLVEKWPVVDSLYFATVVFLTIGYGDLAPATAPSRLYVIFLALYGIVILGIFVGVAGELVVNFYNQQTQERRQIVSSKVMQGIKVPTITDQDETLQQGDSSYRAVDNKEQPLWRDIWKIIALETPVILILIAVSLVIGHYEKWSYLNSLYFLVMTGTTVGFGDLHPNLPEVRIFAIFFLPLSVAVLGELMARIAGLYMDRKHNRAEREFLSRGLTLCDLHRMDLDQNGHVDKHEFLAHMLVALQKVSKEDVDEIMDLFNKLDKDKDEVLSEEDLDHKNWNEVVRSTFQRSLQEPAALPTAVPPHSNNGERIHA
jgi:Ion channel